MKPDPWRVRAAGRVFWLGAALLLLLAACTDVRPVAKIGLIAPFEGLYRRSGYVALDAARAAMTDAPASTTALIPLALDGSADPHRAAQKLRIDPAVRAVVGPLAPAQAAAAGAALRDAGVAWFVPYAVDPAGGFADPLTSDAWATGLVAAAGKAAAGQGARRLLLAGDATGWPALAPAAWAEAAGMPVAIIDGMADDIAAIAGDEAIFWLGAPDAAADFVNLLRPHQPDLPVWIGQGGGDPVLTERAKIDRKLYWLAWSNLHYNGWAAQHTPSTPAAFLVYQATQAAIDAVRGVAPTMTTPWQVELFEYGPDGVSRSFIPGQAYDGE